MFLRTLETALMNIPNPNHVRSGSRQPNVSWSRPVIASIHEGGADRTPVTEDLRRRFTAVNKSGAHALMAAPDRYGNGFVSLTAISRAITPAYRTVNAPLRVSQCESVEALPCGWVST